MSALTKAISACLKSVVKARGGHLYGPNSVPKGVSFCHDLQRYGFTQHINTIIDIGANAGEFALKLHDAIPTADIICCEPVKQTFLRLQKNVEGKGKINALMCAAGRLPGEVEMTSGFDRMNRIVIGNGPGGSSTERVRMRTVADICAERGFNSIGLLKTDTEGHDLEVLRGAEQMINESRVFLVLIETGFENGNLTPFTEAYDYLKKLNFGLVGFYDQDSNGNYNTMAFADALFIHLPSAEKRLEKRW